MRLESWAAFKLTPFQYGYLLAALAFTNDDSDEQGGKPLDDNYGLDDIAAASLGAMLADCDAFEARCAADLAEAECKVPTGCDGDFATNDRERELAGHDFFLTRCGHGCGYWDGDWSEPHATRLTDAAHEAGEVWLYVGDDGLIYQSGAETPETVTTCRDL